MAFVRKIKGSLVRQDSSLYVGEDSYLFYDIDTYCLRRYNGTPGGAPVCIEGLSGSGGGVEAYPTVGDFPAPGEIDVIYIAENTNLIYRWDGSVYIPLISPGADDNVQEYPTTGDFPITGLSDVIYIDAANDSIYYWNGSAYKSIGAGHDTATVTIAPTNTGTVMSILPSANLNVKFLISILDTVDGRFAGSELMGTYKLLDDSVSHSTYSKIGDKIKYRPDVIFSSPNIELQVTNNDTNPITIMVTRIPTLGV